MKVSTRAATTEPFHALAFGAQAAALQARGHHVVRLSIGEPDFGAPPDVRAAMRDAMDGRELPYTVALGLPALRAAIAADYRDRHGVDVDPARVIVTSGASAALLLVLAATVDPGDDVLLADPSYPCNRQLISTFGGRALTVPTTPAQRYQLTADAVRDAWTDRTGVVMVASPSNPTGTSVPPGELARICEQARERGAWRLVDEIYLDLSDPAADGTPARTVLASDPDAIVVNSFSKFFGMTGWRLGWAVLPEALVAPVERLAQNYFIAASTPVQHAALACFTPASLALCAERRREFVARRRLVLDGLAALGLPVPVEPDGAFYVYVDVSSTGLDAWEFCERALAEQHVALTPGRDFSATMAGTHVRLSYAASREELTEGLRRIGAFLTSVAATPTRASASRP
ncbi:aminotransferase class I/II-fold pyridoxal phosphate-dependent enzyme [Kineococcus rhizosphaerae]|uniref:Aminotransferase n=1 Tax=Kineococcus rhizosphaerae TaxID=559628 RepID=A0A2T0R5P4_9ACTN|nr:aminotransferase class I/II-fold pyridoxal phosphate-dependent enzyme [Kineococcus rhizosphaerae]PRY16037.1 aspartate/methionine/tyrosine aminotransferase [Kineococcus rhizosphaerae]